jgi:hypothetical protein
VRGVLERLYRTGQLDQAEFTGYSATYGGATSALKQLRGTRAAELGAVIHNLDSIAAGRRLTASRLPVLFLILANNRRWWTSGPVPGPNQYVEFAGSNLVWEYYPGQGIELQVLATFGKADGLYTAGPAHYTQMRALLDQMIPLAATRAGGLSWEYYFQWEDGSPPWTSAMSQGTALEALTRAATAFGAGSGPSSGSAYLQIAERALPIFTVAPRVGVGVSTMLGARYLQYSFAPQTDIINAFLQSLIGLYDYAQLSGSAQARELFAAGNAQAQAELPRFDTGAWSLYQPGMEDSLDYHTLVTGFLDQLCTRTAAAVYCTTARHFHAYLKTPPTLQLLTTKARTRASIVLRFKLSKFSRMRVLVAHAGHVVFATSQSFPYGVDHVTLVPQPAGTYSVTLAATDLAGNSNQTVGTLQVSRRGR